jgi:hypothetical protein
VSGAAAISETSNKMSDLLAAASLLLTAAGVIYGTWYAEIVAAIGAEIPVHAANRGPVGLKVGAVLRGKAMPLALIAVILTVVFLPDALRITGRGLNILKTEGLKAFCQYDAVETAFCVVVILDGLLASYLLCLAGALRNKLRRINGP